MVVEAIVNIIRQYLEVVIANGIHAEKAILFGSYARGEISHLHSTDC